MMSEDSIFAKAQKAISGIFNKLRGKEHKSSTPSLDNKNDGMDEEDQKPGKVKLNGGEYGTIFGVNRKIVMGSTVMVVLIVFLAFSYSASDKKERSEQSKQITTTDTANTMPTADKEMTSGYDELFRDNQRINRERNAGKKEKNGSDQDPLMDDNGMVHASRNNKSNTEKESNNRKGEAETPWYATTRTPTIPQASFSAPYVLPSAANSNNATSSSSNQKKEEQQQKKSMEDRINSAISFALGLGDAEAGNTDASTGAVSNNVRTESYVANSRYMEPNSSFLQAGTRIPAMLFSGIDTAIPGQVTAQVQSDMYDSATGTTILIPAGSQLIGSYTANTNENSNRVSVTFSTLVLPDGGSYNIGDSMVAVDGGGYSGIAGTLHRHTGAAFGRGILNSAITALSTWKIDRVTLDTSAFNNLTGNIKPTVTVDPGTTFYVYVTKPISFE